jgi:hypothetical protein
LARGNAQAQTHSETSSNYRCTNDGLQTGGLPSGGCGDSSAEREFPSDKVYRRDDRGIVGVESFGLQGLAFVVIHRLGRVPASHGSGSRDRRVHAVGGQTVDPGLPLSGPTTVVADLPRRSQLAGLAVGAGGARHAVAAVAAGAVVDPGHPGRAVDTVAAVTAEWEDLQAEVSMKMRLLVVPACFAALIAMAAAAQADQGGGDADFLAGLNSAGISYKSGPDAVGIGRRACELMDQGHPPAEVIKAMTDQNPGSTTDGAAKFLDIAEKNLCPQHIGGAVASPTSSSPAPPPPPAQPAVNQQQTEDFWPYAGTGSF